jgi:hypothetical protein
VGVPEVEPCDLVFVPGFCAAHAVDEVLVGVPVGYPWVLNETAFWFVGAPHFALEGDCGPGTADCLLTSSNLSGAMARFSGGDFTQSVWIVNLTGLQRQVFMEPGLSNVTVSSFPVIVAPPSGPAWMTPAIAEQLANGTAVPIQDIEGFPTETDDPLGLVPLPYVNIRPGSPLRANTFEGSLHQASCTANFVFVQNGTERMAIGTAGHCENATVLGGRLYTWVVDPETEELRRSFDFGTTIVTTGNSGIGHDFALIEIDSEYLNLVRSSIAVIDGPCSWANAPPGSRIAFYGNSPTQGPEGRVRIGSITSNHGTYIVAEHLPTGGPGDSGSPIRSFDLSAAAIKSHRLWFLPPGWYQLEEMLGSPGTYGTTMAQIMGEILADPRPDVAWMDPGEAGSWRILDSAICNLL